MGMTKAIQVSDLSFGYNDKLVLEGASIDVELNRFSVILGKNGSGKSTFLRILAGLQHYCKGNILVDGKELNKIHHTERARLIGYLGDVYKRQTWA